MAITSSVLAWRIPWAKEPGGLQFTGSQRVLMRKTYRHRHDCFEGKQFYSETPRSRRHSMARKAMGCTRLCREAEQGMGKSLSSGFCRKNKPQ